MADDPKFDATVRIDTEMSIRVRMHSGYAALIEVNIETTSGLHSTLLLGPDEAERLAKELIAAAAAGKV